MSTSYKFGVGDAVRLRADVIHPTGVPLDLRIRHQEMFGVIGIDMAKEQIQIVVGQCPYWVKWKDFVNYGNSAKLAKKERLPNKSEPQSHSIIGCYVQCVTDLAPGITFGKKYPVTDQKHSMGTIEVKNDKEILWFYPDMHFVLAELDAHLTDHEWED